MFFKVALDQGGGALRRLGRSESRVAHLIGHHSESSGLAAGKYQTFNSTKIY